MTYRTEQITVAGDLSHAGGINRALTSVVQIKMERRLLNSNTGVSIRVQTCQQVFHSQQYSKMSGKKWKILLLTATSKPGSSLLNIVL